MGDAVIELKNIYHSYNPGTPIEKRVLQSVTLQVKKGETVGIMGAPGCGKTTLARIMAGMVTPSAGRINTAGTGPGRVGILFQFPEHQLFCSSVFDDITYALKEAASMTGDEINKAYISACLKVGLDPEKVKESRQSELSGGERRRVAIAAVLAMDPSVLILDEPTVGLDQSSRMKVLEEIKRLSGRGCTIIMISHDIEDLLATSKRFILMEDGGIAHDASAAEILLQLGSRRETLPMLPYVTELLVRLSENGLDVKRDIYDPDEAYKEIKRVLDKTP